VLASAAVLTYAAFRYKQILSVTAYFIKAATAKDRQRMREFIQTLTSSFKNQGKRWGKQIERAGYLTKELDKGGTLSQEAFEAREALRLRNEVYLRALKSGDAGVFLRRYPQLFGREAEKAMASGEHPDQVSEEIVAEAAAEKPGRRPAAG
jgi:hypothetical protein